MAIFTLSEITAQKALWKDALAAVSRSQTYRIGDRLLTRAEIPQIQQMLEWLDKLEAEAAAGGGSGPRVVQGIVRR